MLPPFFFDPRAIPDRTFSDALKGTFMGYLHGIETLEVLNGSRPVEVVRSSVIGLIGTAPGADAADYPLNTPTLHIGGAEALGVLGADGTLPDAMSAIFAQGVGVPAIIIRVEEDADEAAQMANVLGDANALTGVHAFLKAQPMFGVSPRIFIAPGFTSQRPAAAANPVVAALQGIALRRRGVILADGPSTTKEDALAYRADWGSDCVYIIDPAVTVFDSVTAGNVMRPASPFIAGLIARVDKQFGYHYSPSNHEIYGITGTARPVDFFMGDEDTEANLLNENRIATIIRENGFRLWGNETTSTEPLNKFLSVRRTHDVIADSIQAAHLWAVDKPFSQQLLLDIAETVNGFLRTLKARGVTLGGKVWIDPAKNTKEQWGQRPPDRRLRRRGTGPDAAHHLPVQPQYRLLRRARGQRRSLSRAAFRLRGRQMTHILRNFTAFVDGYDLRLEVEELTPPVVRDQTEETKAGALDAPVDIPLGLQKLEAGLKINSRQKELMKKAGLGPGKTIRITFRGVSISEIDGSQQNELLVMQGRINADAGAWAAQTVSKTDFKIGTITYYKHLVDGASVYEIDLFNFVRVIGGVDQLAGVRNGLGL